MKNFCLSFCSQNFSFNVWVDVCCLNYFSGCAHTAELSGVLLQRPVKLDPLSWQQTTRASAKSFCWVQPACSQLLRVACFLDSSHHCQR